MSLETFFPSQASRWQHSPDDTLIPALRHLEHQIQLRQPWFLTHRPERSQTGPVLRHWDDGNWLCIIQNKFSKFSLLLLWPGTHHPKVDFLTVLLREALLDSESASLQHWDFSSDPLRKDQASPAPPHTPLLTLPGHSTWLWWVPGVHINRSYLPILTTLINIGTESMCPVFRYYPWVGFQVNNHPAVGVARNLLTILWHLQSFTSLPLWLQIRFSIGHWTFLPGHLFQPLSFPLQFKNKTKQKPTH